MNQITEGVVTIATAIVGVAILAVLVSNKSQTPQVLGAAGSAFSNALSAATGPVTGSTAAPVNQTSSNNPFGSSLNLGNLNIPQQINVG